jgi:hypothetical protein
MIGQYINNLQKDVLKELWRSLPYGQGRVADTQSRHTNTTLPISQPKMANAIFGFGLSHAPESSTLLVLKNGVLLKVTAEKKRKEKKRKEKKS